MALAGSVRWRGRETDRPADKLPQSWRHWDGANIVAVNFWKIIPEIRKSTVQGIRTLPRRRWRLSMQTLFLAPRMLLSKLTLARMVPRQSRLLSAVSCQPLPQ
jgi:hypothetical protein